MTNTDFLCKVLTTDHEYWVVAKKNEIREYGDWKRIEDSIIFISIPYNIERNIHRDEIRLNQLEKLQNSSIHCNVFLNEPYAPFQVGQSFYNIINGYPIESNQKEFLSKALMLKKGSLLKYKEIYESLCNKKEVENA